MIFRPSVTFSVRLSVCQLQRQAVVCQQSHHLWFFVCLSICQLQRYQEMTEFYDVNFLAPTILNAPNKIFGPKLAHSSSTTCYQNFVYKLFDYKIEHLQPMQTSVWTNQKLCIICDGNEWVRTQQKFLASLPTNPLPITPKLQGGGNYSAGVWLGSSSILYFTNFRTISGWNYQVRV